MYKCAHEPPGRPEATGSSSHPCSKEARTPTFFPEHVRSHRRAANNRPSRALTKHPASQYKPTQAVLSDRLLGRHLKGAILGEMEDILQDTLLRFLVSYDPERGVKPATYAIAIAINVIRERLRRLNKDSDVVSIDAAPPQKRPSRDDEEAQTLGQTLRDRQPSIIEQVVKREEAAAKAEAFARLMEELTSKQRLLVVLRYEDAIHERDFLFVELPRAAEKITRLASRDWKEITVFVNLRLGIALTDDNIRQIGDTGLKRLHRRWREVWRDEID